MPQNTHLSEAINDMYKLAIAAQKKAYAPYSKFLVGTCIRADNGKFYPGCNVENAAYGLTICAESGAISTMIADGAHSISEIVVVGSSNQPCSPCGACRQRIREFSLQDLPIHMFDQNGNRKTMTLAELLPESFGPEHLSAL